MNGPEPDNESGPATASVSSKQCGSSDPADLTQAGSVASKLRTRWEKNSAERRQKEDERRQLLEEERKLEEKAKKAKELEQSLQDTQRKLSDVTRELELMEQRKRMLELQLSEIQRKQEEMEVKVAETSRTLHEEEERVEDVRQTRRKEETVMESARRELEEIQKKGKDAEEAAREAVERGNEAEKRRMEEELRTAAALQQAEDAMKLLKTKQEALETELRRQKAKTSAELPADLTRDLAPTQRKLHPEQAAKNYSEAAKAYLKTVTLQSLVEDNLQVFKGYCRGWCAASENISEVKVPDEIVEAADTAFKGLKSFVTEVESLFQQGGYLLVLRFNQCVSMRRQPVLTTVPPEFKDVLQSRLTEFVAEYEKRNVMMANQTRLPVIQMRQSLSLRERLRQRKLAEVSYARDSQTQAPDPSKRASVILEPNNQGHIGRARQTFRSAAGSQQPCVPKPRNTMSRKVVSTLAFNDLPSSTVAIHMGLRHTRVGLFKPGTKEFKLLVDVDNCLYYRNGRVQLAFSTEEKVELGPPDFDLGDIIIDEPVDKNYSVVVNAEEVRLRKEHLLSSFLFLLKCKSELELQMKLPSCVFVVPQFLNTTQRGSINSAAIIAGFTDVKFIDDTAAIALEYMMRVGEKERDVIVVSALESDVIDVAAFKLRNRAVRWIGVSGTHFIKGYKGHGLVSQLLGSWWTGLEFNDTIAKIFNHNELGTTRHRLDHDLKLFVGNEGLLASIVATMETAKNFAVIEKFSPLRGGAYLGSLVQDGRQSPLFKAWEHLETIPLCGQSFGLFLEELLSIQVKEKRRSSNYSTGTPMSVAEVADAKINHILKSQKDLHTVAMNAMKALLAIAEAVKRKEVKDMNAFPALANQLPEYFAALLHSGLTVERAKQLHDQLIKIWHEQVQGPRSSTRYK